MQNETEKKVNREEKKQLISEMNDIFQKAGLVVVTLNKGLTMGETTELRNKIREDGASYRVTKNRLTKLALKGTPCEDLTDLMTGPTAVAYSEDALSAAKAVVKFAKDNEHLEVVGGVMNGQKVSLATINELAFLPTLDELRGKLVGLFQAPGAQLARLAQAYADKDAA